MPGDLGTPQNCWAMAHVGSGQLQKWCVLWGPKEKTKLLPQFINSLSDFLSLLSALGSLVNSLRLQCMCLHLQEKFVGNPHTKKPTVLRTAVLKKGKGEKEKNNKKTAQGYIPKSVTHAQKKLISGECQLSTSPANK